MQTVINIDVAKFDEFHRITKRAQKYLGSRIQFEIGSVYRVGSAKSLSVPGLKNAREYVPVKVSINNVFCANNFDYYFIGTTEMVFDNQLYIKDSYTVCDCCGRQRDFLYLFAIQNTTRACGAACLHRYFNSESAIQIEMIAKFFDDIKKLECKEIESNLFWKENLIYKLGDRIDIELKVVQKTHQWVPVAGVDEALAYKVEFEDKHGGRYFVVSQSSIVTQLQLGAKYSIRATYQGRENSMYKINRISVNQKLAN